MWSLLTVYLICGTKQVLQTKRMHQWQQKTYQKCFAKNLLWKTQNLMGNKANMHNTGKASKDDLFISINKIERQTRVQPQKQDKYQSVYDQPFVWERKWASQTTKVCVRRNPLPLNCKHLLHQQQVVSPNTINTFCTTHARP